MKHGKSEVAEHVKAKVRDKRKEHQKVSKEKKEEHEAHMDITQRPRGQTIEATAKAEERGRLLCKQWSNERKWKTSRCSGTTRNSPIRNSRLARGQLEEQQRRRSGRSS